MSEEKAELTTQSEKLPTNTNGSLKLSTLDQQLSFGATLLKQQLVSSTFKNAAQVAIGIQYAISMNVDPIIALRQMYVIKGVPNLFGDGPLMMIQRSGKMESIKEFWIDENCLEICVKNKNIKSEIFAAVTQIKRFGDPEIQEDFFSLDDLQKAGMNIGPSGEKVVWKKYKRIMMRYKARTLALKSKFADLLNGVEISEYIHNFNPDMPEINNPNQKDIDSSDISETLSGQTGVAIEIPVVNCKTENVKTVETTTMEIEKASQVIFDNKKEDTSKKPAMTVLMDKINKDKEKASKVVDEKFKKEVEKEVKEMKNMSFKI